MMVRPCLVYQVVCIILLVRRTEVVVNSLVTTASSSNESERLALLAFKHQITDPLGALRSWNDSVHYCEWHGVTCSRRHANRVTVLDLESQKLQGTLSPHIGNLSFLKRISLTMNNFGGPIPQELGRLFRLETLLLNNNSFTGDIPTNLTHCSNLGEINLIDNKLTGGIPLELTSLSNLKVLYLAKNELLGSIPSSLGNLSSLEHLSLALSNLTGTIPDDLCRIRGLSFFHVGGNSLTGKIPSCMYNLSGITIFSVAYNQLDGTLPPDIGFTLPNLETFNVGRNNFKGTIPLSFSNASKLEMLALYKNKFTGRLPKHLGRLQGLYYLDIATNQLEDDIEFITSLTNCSNLETLSLTNNIFQGSLPESIANLSTKITGLYLGSNRISGSLPTGIGNLINLDEFSLHENRLTGEIPATMRMLSKLQRFALSANGFSGQIPDIFVNTTLLFHLNLSQNNLHGKIPLSLANSPTLFELDLSDNKLNCTLPKQVIGGLFKLVALNISHNAFFGPLPSEVGNLTKLVLLDISNNSFSGHISDMLSSCSMLVDLFMQNNLFYGKIPELRHLQGIEHLDLSHNKLTGEIPQYLVNLTGLVFLDLSYNELEGPIPRDGVFAKTSAVSIVGNSRLCGGITALNLLPCHIQTIKKKGKYLTLKIGIPVILIGISFLVLSWFLFMYFHKRTSKEQHSSQPNLNREHMRVSYEELLKATNSFSTENLIGIGSYSSVYKGLLDQVNTIIAVKVFNLQQRGDSKVFLSECNALRNLRHRNILKIITSCSSINFQGNDFKAIVTEFMPNGSLEKWLHPKKDEEDKLRNLNFVQRINIAIDVASAMDYFHNHSQPVVVHCDLKPSNVLLDDDMTAHVADFGLAKIFAATSHDSSQTLGSSLAVKGSIGYVAPEYGVGSEVSILGDVYSYGILLLEMFTGKRPTDDIFHDGRDLHGFANKALAEDVMNVIDKTMLLDASDEAICKEKQCDRQVTMQECMSSVIRLGVICSSESPIERLNMGEVTSKLYSIRDHYQAVTILKSGK